MIRISKAARQDLLQSFQYGIRTFGVRRAAAYRDELSHVFHLLASTPDMGSRREELPEDLRVHRHGRHVIVYRPLGADINIVRVLADSQDWLNVF